MGNLLSDIRHSFRILRKSPGFTIIAVLALALGIGANTAIFSVIDRVLLSPLPFKDSGKIMRIERTYPTGGADSTSIPKYMAWRKAAAFQSTALYDFQSVPFNLGSGDRPNPANALHVSAGFFDVFGVQPVLGRTFTPQEDLPNAGNFTVLTYDFWKNRLNSDRSVIGRPILLSSTPCLVLGVLEQGYLPDPPTDIYLSLQADPNSTNQGHYLNAAGRLAPGATVDQAQAQLKVIASQFQAAHPDTMDKQETAGAVPLQDELAGSVKPALLILSGAVLFVLLMACANVAGLLLARATGRQKELAIRSAIGASRGRIIRQLLTESLLLAIAGGIGGLILGGFGVQALLAASPGNIPRINDPDHAVASLSMLDWRILAFLFAISLLTGLLFGILPAIQISRPDVNTTLKESSGRSGTGMKQNRLRSLLVIGEMALALVLLVGAALMIRTFAGLRAVNPGFATTNVLTLKTSLASGRYATTAQVDNMVREVSQRLEALPAVQGAASTVILPLEGGVDLPFTIAGRTPSDGGKWEGDEQWRTISPHYFSVLRIPLLRGRVFDEHDAGKSTPVVIINEALAKKYFPKTDPVGQRMIIGKGLGPQFDDDPREIVGIVGSVHETGLNSDVPGEMYLPVSQMPQGMTTLANSVMPLSWVIRTQTDPQSISVAVQQTFVAYDAALAPVKVKTMKGVLADSTAREDFDTLLLGVFAAMALLLAAIGIYGLMSYSVQQRSQEFGIRMALGAARGQVMRMVLQHGMILAAIGIAIGVAAAVGLTRLLKGLLFGVKSSDPITYLTVAAILAGVALLAVVVPAHRATRIDPLTALRVE